MSETALPEAEAVLCPICGAKALKGCLYAVAPLLFSRAVRMTWRSGPPGLASATAGYFGAGTKVGTGSGLMRGPHVEGIRCTICRHIVLKS